LGKPRASGASTKWGNRVFDLYLFGGYNPAQYCDADRSGPYVEVGKQGCPSCGGGGYYGEAAPLVEATQQQMARATLRQPLLSPRRSPCTTHLFDFWTFSLEHSRWRQLPSLGYGSGGGPSGRRGHCSFGRGGRFVVVHGGVAQKGAIENCQSGSCPFLNDLWQYDVELGAWQQLGQSSEDETGLPQGRHAHVCAHVDNLYGTEALLVWGGQGYEEEHSMSGGLSIDDGPWIGSFRPATRTDPSGGVAWKKLQPMGGRPWPLAQSYSGAFGQANLFVFGGMSSLSTIAEPPANEIVDPAWQPNRNNVFDNVKNDVEIKPVMNRVWRLQFGPTGTIYAAQPASGRCSGGVQVMIYGSALSDGTTADVQVYLAGAKAEVLSAAPDGRSIVVRTGFSCGAGEAGASGIVSVVSATYGAMSLPRAYVPKDIMLSFSEGLAAGASSHTPPSGPPLGSMYAVLSPYRPHAMLQLLSTSPPLAEVTVTVRSTKPGNVAVHRQNTTLIAGTALQPFTLMAFWVKAHQYTAGGCSAVAQRFFSGGADEAMSVHPSDDGRFASAATAGLTVAMWVKRNTQSQPLVGAALQSAPDTLFDWGRGRALDNVVITFEHGTTYEVWRGGDARATTARRGASLAAHSDARERFGVGVERTFPFDIWVHVAVIQDKSGYAQILWDGEPQASALLQLPRDVRRRRAQLGASNWMASERPGFRGEIKDVFVYDRALTRDELLTLKDGRSVPWSMLLTYVGMRTWCDSTTLHKHACHGASNPSGAESLDSIVHEQWGLQSSDFRASSLEECRAKCSAAPGCTAVSYHDPGAGATSANCLPVLAEYQGTFEASGWDCWRRGDPLLNAPASADEDDVQLIVTTESADPDYNKLELPTLRLATRSAASLVVSHVVDRTCQPALGKLSQARANATVLLTLVGAPEQPVNVIVLSDNPLVALALAGSPQLPNSASITFPASLPAPPPPPPAPFVVLPLPPPMPPSPLLSPPQAFAEVYAVRPNAGPRRCGKYRVKYECGVLQPMDQLNAGECVVQPNGDYLVLTHECNLEKYSGDGTLLASSKTSSHTAAGGCRAVVLEASNEVVQNHDGVYSRDLGGWGAKCTCPDNQVYGVGDRNDHLGSVACVGGTMGEKLMHGGDWSHKGVICQPKNKPSINLVVYDRRNVPMWTFDMQGSTSPVQASFKGWHACSSTNQCGLGEGSCVHDSDCQPGLKCFQRDRGEQVPGLIVDDVCNGQCPGVDFCYKPDYTSAADSFRSFLAGGGCYTPKLIKAGSECRSSDTYLGKFETVQACASKCAATKGCRYFLYGIRNRAGRCYYERTESANCYEGFYRNSYDFYDTQNLCASGTAQCPNEWRLVGSNVWSEYPALSRTISLDVTRVVMATYQVAGWVPHTYLTSKLFVDGIEQPQTRSIAGNTLYVSNFGVFYASLPAGEHTFVVKYRTTHEAAQSLEWDWGGLALNVAVLPVCDSCTLVSRAPVDFTALSNLNRWTMWPGLETLVDLKTRRTVLASYQADGYSFSHVLSKLFVDGVEQKSTRSIAGNTVYWSNMGFYMASLPAGRHRFHVSYRTPGRVTHGPGGSDWQTRGLNVLVLPETCEVAASVMPTAASPFPSTPAEWKEWPGLSASVSITGAGAAVVLATYQTSSGLAGGWLTSRLLVDGAIQPQTVSIAGQTAYGTTAGTYMGMLDAGDHTFTVESRALNAINVQTSTSDWQVTALNVLVCREPEQQGVASAAEPGHYRGYSASGRLLDGDSSIAQPSCGTATCCEQHCLSADKCRAWEFIGTPLPPQASALPQASAGGFLCFLRATDHFGVIDRDVPSDSDGGGAESQHAHVRPVHTSGVSDAMCGQLNVAATGPLLSVARCDNSCCCELACRALVGCASWSWSFGSTLECELRTGVSMARSDGFISGLVPPPPPAPPPIELQIQAYQGGGATLTMRTSSEDVRYDGLVTQKTSFDVRFAKMQSASGEAECSKPLTTRTRPDPERQAWFQPAAVLSNMSKAFPPGRYGASVLAKKGKLFIFGGQGGVSDAKLYDDVWEFDMARGTFRGPLVSDINAERLELGRAMLDQPSPRMNHAAASVGSYMAVFGGRTSKGAPIGCYVNGPGVAEAQPTSATKQGGPNDGVRRCQEGWWYSTRQRRCFETCYNTADVCGNQVPRNEDGSCAYTGKPCVNPGCVDSGGGRNKPGVKVSCEWMSCPACPEATFWSFADSQYSERYGSLSAADCRAECARHSKCGAHVMSEGQCILQFGVKGQLRYSCERQKTNSREIGELRRSVARTNSPLALGRCLGSGAHAVQKTAAQISMLASRPAGATASRQGMPIVSDHRKRFKTWADCFALAVATGASHFLLEDPLRAPTEGTAQCGILMADEMASVPRSARRPMSECEDAVDTMGRPLGAEQRAAIYSTARLAVNQTYLNDLWLFRYPQLPWQPRVRKDGLPRFDEGTSLPH